MCATLTRIICRSRSRRRTNPKVEKDMSTETREDGMECACNVEMKRKYTLEHKLMECTYGRNALGGGRATFHSWWIHMLCNDSGMNESDSHILYSMPCENTTCVCVRVREVGGGRACLWNDSKAFSMIVRLLFEIK